MKRTWPSPLTRIVACGLLVALVLYNTPREVREWLDGSSSTFNLVWSLVVALLCTLMAWMFWRETLTLTDGTLRFRNTNEPVREVPLAEVVEVVPDRYGMAVTFRSGETVRLDAFDRYVMGMYLHRPSLRSRRAAAAIGDALARLRAEAGTAAKSDLT
ncbi:hypothetical protein CS0771_17420 [Catellatospora sp. IY07-71]|uniref:hypothetical protein n=1 Tax=Catellatospora sp. IY07-71 TaxID=2728827 RepID=UPI001BB39404|nr:hypothetical protein [Catellatospora sp. IY07-71]BCJ72198.1 hypothetical protein CS0771_17420 [Catellatospora sp. IY07-71]